MPLLKSASFARALSRTLSVQAHLLSLLGSTPRIGHGSVRLQAVDRVRCKPLGFLW